LKYKTILVCGLPGSGKTFFAEQLKTEMADAANYFNADIVRMIADDWDFSDAGRERQLQRMKRLAAQSHANGRHAILDLICPREEYRKELNPDVVVWADRTPVREYANTTAIFEPPIRWDYRITDDSKLMQVMRDVRKIAQNCDEADITAPTALMIGRYQPWHDGHKALFLKALEKHGQVCIGVRTMPVSDSNPFSYEEVAFRIHDSLAEYENQYTVVQLPNIVDVVYGREVGWTVSKIDLPPEIEAISATQIRAQMQK